MTKITGFLLADEKSKVALLSILSNTTWFF
jgi:hypothetical protein